MDLYVDDYEPSGGASAGSAAAPSWREIAAFGSNPGNLSMHLFTSSSKRQKHPLVVVLHGCTQTVESYDRGSGWSRLAAQHDFLVLMPGQKQANNFRTCFSWFEPGDIQRDSGEALSIRQMIAVAVADHGADPARIFICGLSAGGAMACAMLAVYPELFLGGAIIAGLPFSTAAGVAEAVESMQVGRVKEARVWGDAIRTAAPHTGRWPDVAIWQGTADDVVKPINAGELVKQWTNVHGVAAEVPAENHIGRATQRIWHDAEGHARVTEYSVSGLGHGAPVDDIDPPAPFFIPAGLSSTRIIADDWGLTTKPPRGPLAILRSLLK